MSQDQQPLLIERANGVAILTWNRPQVLNAIDAVGARALLEALSALEDDDAIGCVLLAGAGRSFMAGGDIAAMHRALPDPRAALKEILTPFHEAIRIIHRMPQPVVAVVQGHAAGAGASLAFATDFAVAAESAVFTLSYARIGATPDGSATYSLPRLVGVRRAMEIAMLAEPMPAARALELGLVNRVVPDGQLQAEARALAERLAAGPRAAQAATKRLMRQSLDTPLAEQLDAERDSFLATSLTADFAEGVAAFRDKRPTRFGKK